MLQKYLSQEYEVVVTQPFNFEFLTGPRLRVVTQTFTAICFYKRKKFGTLSKVFREYLEQKRSSLQEKKLNMEGRAGMKKI